MKPSSVWRTCRAGSSPAAAQAPAAAVRLRRADPHHHPGAVSALAPQPPETPRPGTLTVHGDPSDPADAARNHARTEDICDFPPFASTSLPAAPDLAVRGPEAAEARHPLQRHADFQQYVLLEYSAYRMYNLLTPHSFRARLADIDYRDDNGRPIISRVGYFLEDLDDVAKRNGMKAHMRPDAFRSPISPTRPRATPCSST